MLRVSAALVDTVGGAFFEEEVVEIRGLRGILGLTV